MPRPTIGLYIGKFQPFHNGHVSAVRHISSQVDRLIIVIGSSQYHGTADQPFSATERRQMIEQSISAERLPILEIVEIPDIHDPEHWVEHVRHFVPHFDTVYTNNELVRELFEAADFTVAPIPFLPGVSGTLVRKRLANNEQWLSLVPESTARVINSLADER